MRDRIARDLAAARDRTLLLTAVVDEPDLIRQHHPLMSPLVWDLAHVGQQEDLWLLRAGDAHRPGVLPTEVDQLYDAFRYPRAARPALPLLPPAQARGFLTEVRSRVLDRLHEAEELFPFAMVVQHEQQHDETMLATHQLRAGPPVLAGEPLPTGVVAPPRAEVLVPAGPFTMGTSSEPWALDNERPAHTVDVPAFVIDTVPVTNGRYAEFIEAGGYRDQRWWSPEGWRHVREAGLEAPQFWQRDGDQFWRRRFGVLEPVGPDEPVVHVCFHEAQAYAAWAGKRLPTETEWEKAARWDPASGRSRRYPWGDDDPRPEHANLGQRHLGPAPVGAYPAGASPLGVHQLIGDVWEWTSSGWYPYPGFEMFPYPEYSQVFFGGDYRVLRGGSFGTAPAAVRATFRNWDHPIRRQIFSGFRCARDASPGEIAAGRVG